LGNSRDAVAPFASIPVNAGPRLQPQRAQQFLRHDRRPTAFQHTQAEADDKRPGLNPHLLNRAGG